MKRLLSTTLLLLILFSGFCHDIRMAIFEITKGADGLNMAVTLDKDYFEETLRNEFADSYNSKKWEEMAWQYLLSKVTIEVNGNCTDFEIKEIEYTRESIHLSGSLNLQLENIEEVKMTNTCMIDFLEGHDNIMKLKLNDRVRSFRLNKKRTSTIASYTD